MITNQIIKDTYNVHSVNQSVLYILLRYSVPRNIYIYIYTILFNSAGIKG